MSNRKKTPKPAPAPELPDLSILLTPPDVADLAAAGREPDEYTALTLKSSQVQTSKPLQDGSIVLLLHVVVPPNLISSKASLLSINGAANALDGAFGVNPEARLLVKIDRLMPRARLELQRYAAHMLAQGAPAAGPAPGDPSEG